MQNSKRMLCLLLAACMLGAVGCGKTEQKELKESQNSDTAQDTEQQTESQETRIPLGLEEQNFDGKHFRISYETNTADKLRAEEATGEKVNDAIYDRNALLMDSYNMVFEYVDTAEDWIKHVNAIKRTVDAGEDAWEMIIGHVVLINNLAVQGYDRNLHNVPNLQFDKPWWPSQSVDEMTVYGKMFTICGSYSTEQLGAGKVIYFNKDLLDEAKIEYPYQEVKDGTWTLDRLIERSAEYGWIDRDGGGERDMGDIYGFCTQPVQNGFLVSTNTPVLAKTPDGGREITVLSEKTMALVEKLYSWYFESGNVYIGNREGGADYYEYMFRDGHAAYAFAFVNSSVSTFKDSDVRYGIVPMPKWDELQENYYVFACPGLISIPISCKSDAFAGYIIEAMTYYGYYMIIPAYYESTLKGRIADQQEDAEMLEIINDHLTVSFAYCYDNWEGFAHLMSALGFDVNPNKDLASMYQKRHRQAEKRLEKILYAFQNYGEVESQN